MIAVPNTVAERKSGRRRASALLAVYWVVAILSLAVFTGAQFLFVELETQGNAALEFRAEQLADAGIALAMHPKVERWDPILAQQVGPAEGFHTRIVSEGARLNPNVLALTVEGRRVLIDLFLRWGLSEFDSRSLAEALCDWVDRDDEALSLGAETREYLGRGALGIPFNRPFHDLEEMLFVRGFDEVAVRFPAWRDAFTLWSGGKLDLTDAPPELIAITCTCSEGRARRFAEVRNGYDGIPHTEDDIEFGSVEQALALLGLQGVGLESVENLVSVGDAASRLIAVGSIGDVSVERAVVIRNRNQNSSFLEVRTRRLR